MGRVTDSSRPSPAPTVVAPGRRTFLETMLAAGAFFVGSIALIPLLPKGFIPSDDFGQTQVSIELPPGNGREHFHRCLRTLAVFAPEARST